MSHYMELLSMHQPWFLILFMVMPIIFAETILACSIFGFIYKGNKAEAYQKFGQKISVVLGVYFIALTAYLVVFYLPAINEWRGIFDYIAIFSYILAVVPAAALLLQQTGLWKQSKVERKEIIYALLLILFVVFTHMAMVFGMVDPRLAGYMTMP